MCDTMRYCKTCKHYKVNPILKNRGWCDLDKVNILIPETEHCEMWAKKTDDTPLFNIMC